MPEFDDGVIETALPTGDVVTADVVVAGSGPGGASAALFLSSLGVDNIMITKYRWTANTPRAHITNQRTMEIFRDLGIEAQVQAEATPHDQMGDTVFCASIAGEELGRILTWGTSPARHGDYVAASASLNCDIPQTYLEPILVRDAMIRGTVTRFSTEYLAHVQDPDGVSPGLEAGRGPARAGRPGTAEDLHCRAGTRGEADRRAGQPVGARVRADLPGPSDSAAI